MSLDSKNVPTISQLTAEFETAWNTGKPPSIQEFVGKIDASHRRELLQKLIPIDARFRRDGGESVSPADYFEYSGKGDKEWVWTLFADESLGGSRDVDKTRFADDDMVISDPTRVGPYRIQKRLGEGGMGIVYLAEQTEPVRRKVALKIIKPGLDTKASKLRFDAERQALAMMDHDNIAKVFEAGAAKSGQPYFAMEYIQGVSLTEYCDHNKLTLAERLRLFISICKGVQHAHQKGIIHRDIKPSNILVASPDSDPIPKLIDFGLAKPSHDQLKLTDKTIGYEGNAVGTLLYMSPEQTDGNTFDVDSRTDIYSLGVLLYELLTGTTPLHRETAVNDSLAIVYKRIREDDPPAPSTRLTTTTLPDSVEVLSRNRNIDPSRLKQALKGDLDWIVMKALEKDRTRRYETASGLAEDVNRFLTDQPVLARPPSVAYQLQKIYRRHQRVIVTAASFLFLSVILVAGMISTSIEAVYARKKAVEAERVAQRNLEKAEQAEKESKRQSENYRRLFYWSDMQAAETAYRESNMSNVVRLLDRHDPLPGQDDIRGFESRMLWKLAQRTVMTPQVDLGERISDIVFSGGATKVSTLTFKLYRQWDLITRSESTTVPIVASDSKLLVSDSPFAQVGVSRTKMSPDGKWIAAGHFNGGISVIDTSTWESRNCQGPTEQFRTFAFSADGKYVAAGYDNGLFKVWDLESDVEIEFADRHTNRVYSMAFSPDGAKLATGSRDKTVKVWDLESGELMWQLDRSNQKQSIWAVCFSRDSSKLAFGTSGFPAVYLADSASGQGLKQLGIFGGSLSSLAFDEQDESLAASSTDGSIKIWDLKSFALKNEFKKIVNYDVCLSFSPDGKHLAAGGNQGRFTIWPVDLPKAPVKLTGHTDNVECFDVSPDGRLLASGGPDKTVRIWSMESNSQRQVLDGHAEPIGGITFDPKSPRLATLSNDGALKVWNTNTWQMEFELSVPPESPKKKTGRAVVQFSPDGTKIAIVGIDARLTIWDARSKKLIWEPRSDGDDMFLTLAFLNDHRFVTSMDSASGNHNLKFWNLDSRDLESEVFLETKGKINSLDFSRERRMLALGSLHAGTVSLFDAASQKVIWTQQQGNRVSSVAFDRRGHVVSAGNGAINFWNPVNGNILFRLAHPHNDVVFQAELDPNNTMLITASGDDTIKLWKAVTDKELQQIQSVLRNKP